MSTAWKPHCLLSVVLAKGLGWVSRQVSYETAEEKTSSSLHAPSWSFFSVGTSLGVVPGFLTSLCTPGLRCLTLFTGWTNLCLTFWALLVKRKQFCVCWVSQTYDTERNDLPLRAAGSWRAGVNEWQWDMLGSIYVSFVFPDTLGWQWIVSDYINLPSVNSSWRAWTFSG